MIAIDSNILVYARRKETPHNAEARRLLEELATGEAAWAIPWPCVYEYLRVVTHRRVFVPPTELNQALDELDALMESPALTLLGEGPTHAAHLRLAVGSGRAVGNLAHDAHIAALCVEHGVRELWTADRDFARFPGLNVRNPFEPRGLHEPRAPYRTRGASRGASRTPGRRRRA
ncbi:MAG: PIN domain-containing protein [Acidobacteria bacterium]|nr:PIN domain-containing protein [Acidobacteriota bacterium]